ncbi:MAG TPA: ATP-dependent DNA helicase RecG [Bacteroidia bacterium]|nr:ATP-dependent DNA helicase RecG [Bacteroidia bacterium]HNT80670.1 ATP-dependent DNA helicase RecG [Bacteroidia bacterium]
MANLFFDTPITYLKGVGPQRAELLQKELGILTYGDFIHHYPFRYVDRTKVYALSELQADMPYVQFRGFVKSIKELGERKSKRLSVMVSDGKSSIELVWFKGIKWIIKSLAMDKEYLIFGKPSEFNGKINFVHPEMDLLSEEQLNKNSGWMPVYNTTERCKSRGLDSKGISKLMFNLLKQMPLTLEETLRKDTVEKLKLMYISDALQQIHFPESIASLNKAISRLKFEEAFYQQLMWLYMKAEREEEVMGIAFNHVGDLFNTFYKKHLSFELTQAQKRVIKEIRRDIGSGKQMNRLLQGDVGSGKTMVAFLSILISLDNGYQGCIMAPTEILAQQHYESIRSMTEHLPVKVDLLTGSTKGKQREQVLSGAENGDIHILIGTHALLEDSVNFNKLGLVVIDEQHRFGVEQRAKLWMKNGIQPHILVMTATPIPRTLALTAYGDLDTSVIDEMPVGRKPIQTIHRFDNERFKVYEFIREQIHKGRQAYIVYPLISESDKLELENLMEGFDLVSDNFPHPKYKLSIVHGKMKAADKELEMQRFVEGKTQIMVSTTVIEVGVNVPNATVMLIENANRFGLSQLHQLRGRVGRGADQSYCFLLSSFKLSEDSRERIKTMVKTNDGFEIAETDLRLRGPGDMAGTQQSGKLPFKLIELSKDVKMIELARNIAADILKEDPKLLLPKNNLMSERIKSAQENYINWTKVS